MLEHKVGSQDSGLRFALVSRGTDVRAGLAIAHAEPFGRLRE